jgi:hypothetical protein
MSILNMITQWSWSWWWWGNVWEPTNLIASTSWLDATIIRTDNNLNTIPPTTFAKSELVRKAGSAPSSPSDWTIVVTETVMNTYQSVWYVDSWLTDWTTYYYKVFSYSTDWGISYCNAVSVTPTSWWWQPWANTLAYYTLNNDGVNKSTLASKFYDITLNTATYSTSKAHWNNTYSLYCDGNTNAYIPASALHEFGDNDFTISVWVNSETSVWQHTWFISNYTNTIGYTQNIVRWYRVSDIFSYAQQLNFCRAPWDSGGIQTAWVDGTTNISIYNDWWHNVVITRINGVLSLYLDWNTTPVRSTSWYTTDYLGRNANIYLGVNSADGWTSKVYMNDLIFESAGWTAQEVADYYALTS